MRTSILLIVALFATVHINAQTNSGDANPVPQANWEKKANGWISKWVFNNINSDGWFNVTSSSGDVKKIYVEIISTEQERQMYLGKYSNGEFAAYNRNWMKFKIGSKIWFTEEEYSSYTDIKDENNELIKYVTTATDATCGNAMTIERIVIQQPTEEGVAEEQGSVSNNRFANLGQQQSRNQIITETPRPSYAQQTVDIDPCTELQRSYAILQSQYDQGVIKKKVAKVQFQNLQSMDTRGCLAGMEMHYDNTWRNVAIGAGLVALGTVATLVVANNLPKNSSNAAVNIPLTEPHRGTKTSDVLTTTRRIFSGTNNLQGIITGR